MTVAILASAASIHTIRWVNGLTEVGIRVMLLTQHEPIEAPDPRVRLIRLPYSGATGYLRNVMRARAAIDEFQADVVHAHFAFGYAAMARLVGRRPLVVSVMGTDVDDVPHRNPMFKAIVRSNLMAADAITASSRHLLRQIRQLAGESPAVHICPYGVAGDRFVPAPVRPADRLVFGTVKMLEPVYGIDRLIRAYRRFLDLSGPDGIASSSLRIVGSGSQGGDLHRLADALGLREQVRFVPSVPHAQVPSELSEMDVFMALSHREGFGVAIAEAGMMGLPAIGSDVGGIPEIIQDGISGFLVDGGDIEQVAERMRRYARDPELRRAHGSALREHVRSQYEWTDSLRQMEAVYRQVLGGA